MFDVVHIYVIARHTYIIRGCRPTQRDAAGRLRRRRERGCCWWLDIGGRCRAECHRVVLHFAIGEGFTGGWRSVVLHRYPHTGRAGSGGRYGERTGAGTSGGRSCVEDQFAGILEVSIPVQVDPYSPILREDSGCIARYQADGMCSPRRKGDRLCAEEGVGTGGRCVGEGPDGDAGHPFIGLAGALGTAVADLSVGAAHAHGIPGIGGGLDFRRTGAVKVHGRLDGPRPGIGVARSGC